MSTEKFIGTAAARLAGQDHSRMLINPPAHRKRCLCIIHLLQPAQRGRYCCVSEMSYSALGDVMDIDNY